MAKIEVNLYQKHLGSGALAMPPETTERHMAVSQPVLFLFWQSKCGIPTKNGINASRLMAVWSFGASGSLAIALWRSPALPNPDVFGREELQD